MSNPPYVGIDATAGQLILRWFWGESDDPPRISFHYAAGNGFEWRRHHHDQDHISG